MSDFSLKRLRLLAEYGGFERNAYWHRRLARVYRDATYFNAAIKEYGISIQMNDQDWAAHWGMGFTYQERKDYLSAIEWHCRALAALPKESKVEKAGVLHDISACRTLLEDKSGAIEASYEAYSLSPESTDTSVGYLTALENGSEFQTIMDLAANLQVKPSAQEGENMLTVLFGECWGQVHEIIGSAAKKLGKIDTAERFMREAVAAAEQRKSSREVFLQCCLLGLADFLNQYAYKIDEAIETYESALDHLPKRVSGYEFSYHRTWARDSLSQLYYLKAEAAECAGVPFDHWVSKLEGLAKTRDAKDMETSFASRNPSLGLGLWYRLHGREQEAKLCFRAQILDGIDTLTDDDPGNDMMGWMTLAITLLKAGDRENAGAAFAVTIASLDRLKENRRAAQKPVGENEAPKNQTIEMSLNSNNAGTLVDSFTSSIEKEETENPEKKTQATNENTVTFDDTADTDSAEMTTQIKDFDDIYLPWGCDGKCKRRDEEWQELHFCEICLDSTCFCDECIKLVKSGTLPFRKCDAKHTFYQAYPPIKEVQGVATVETEGKILPRKEWLEALRKEWAA